MIGNSSILKTCNNLIKQTFCTFKKGLMNGKISFFILSYTGSTVKQSTVSKRFLGIISACVAIFIILSVFVIYDYINIKTTFNKQELESKIANQNDEIVNQRRQIQNFADEINTLKSKLLVLSNFEKKIRIIANIKKPDDHDSLFGVGGSVPEDLDSQVPLKEKHNSLMREMHSAIRPTKGWISSSFGYRKSPFTDLREFHKGMDIANRKGTPIVATADGIVTFTGYKTLLGRMIKIDHGYGMATLYGHLQKVLKKPGEEVKRGDIIAQMGDSGRCTGPHLHYEVLLNGIPVNPKKYILN